MDEVPLIDHLNNALAVQLPSWATWAVHEVAAQTVVYPSEMARLHAAMQSRKNEFATGRRCLREALQQQGIGVEALLSDSDGVPDLPAGAIGSISHSRGQCAAIAARASDAECLGLDLEKTTRLSAGAMKKVVHLRELQWVDGDQRRASLLFSVKEAFYKAQFPKWRCLANFHDLALTVDEVTQSLKVDFISEKFPEELVQRSTSLQFRYQFVGEYVVTLCWLPILE